MLCLWTASEGSQFMRQTLASVQEVYQAWVGYGLYEDDKRVYARTRWLNAPGGAAGKETAAGAGSGAGKTIYCLATQQGGAELRTDDKAPTLTAAAGMSGNNQPVICAGFKPNMGAKARGIGYEEEKAPTMDTGTPNAVYDARGNGDGKTVCTLTGDHEGRVTDYTAIVVATGQAGAEITQDVSHTLNCNHEQPILIPKISHTLKAKANLKFREDSETYIVQGLVRRLTPLECERLQGYTDGWTDIGPWTDSAGKLHKESSDSARYKDLGNSIALPPWKWVLKRLCACYERDATMASLFDGISGFCLIWAQLNGIDNVKWCSEIEEFPIAVTKKHFGDETTGVKGDLSEILFR